MGDDFFRYFDTQEDSDDDVGTEKESVQANNRHDTVAMPSSLNQSNAPTLNFDDLLSRCSKNEKNGSDNQKEWTRQHRKMFRSEAAETVFPAAIVPTDGAN